MKAILSLLVFVFFLHPSSLAGAQVGTTLLVKTDMSCEWKLDGQSMGQLAPDGPKVVLVSPGEHLIDASATVGSEAFRTRVQVDKVEKTVEIQLKSPHALTPKIQQVDAPRTQAQDEAARTKTWTDPATGLMWTKEDNGSDVDWLQAKDYCSQLQLAGYSDWRLPTTEELKGIYDPSISVENSFDDGVTFDVHVKGHLTLTGETWSGSQGEGLGQPYQTQWEFTFGTRPHRVSSVSNPFLNFMHFSFDMRALCVRSAAQ
jgi:hypothetical protein